VLVGPCKATKALWSPEILGHYLQWVAVMLKDGVGSSRVAKQSSLRILVISVEDKV
jgi:hypothetical protein